MTTNLAESVNSILKDTHNLPITTLIEVTYYRLAKMFMTRQMGNGSVLTCLCFQPQQYFIYGRGCDKFTRRVTYEEF
ncbi:hypothetical protein CR513_44754, partial [Mucuna pruriens]